MKQIIPTNRRVFALSLHLVGALVVLGVIGVYYVGVYRPLQAKEAAYRNRTEQLDALSSQTGSEASQNRQLRGRLSEIETAVAQINAQLAAQTHDPAWVESITELASSVDLEISNYQIGVTETLPTHTQTAVDISCLGSYDSICRFLEKAEQLTKTTKLSKFKLGPAINLDRYPIQLTFVLYSEGQTHDTKEKRVVL